jgi:hypothetical protein
MISSQAKLDAARAVADKATSFVEGVRDDVDRLREAERSIAVDRSLQIRNSLKAGDVPAFEPVPHLSQTAAALAEKENLLRSAEIARQHLEAEAGDASRVLNAASDSVRASAETLMLAEATAIAQEIESLDAQSLELRTRLGGGSYAPIAMRGRPLTPALMRMLQMTDRMAEASIGDFAGRLHEPMRAAGRAWLRHIDELVERPDAELNFDDPPAEEAKAA